MTQTQHSLRYAGSAIAAALAIASTPSLAQDAAAPFPTAPEPVIVVPDIPVPVAPEPTIVLPSAQPETVQPVPETSIEEPAPQPVPAATTARTRTTAPAARAAAEPAPRTAAAEPAPVQEPAALPSVDTVEPVAALPAPPVTTTTAPAPLAADDNTGILALILGGLAFLALAIWGFIAIGRRKSVRRYAAESAPKPVPVAPRPAVVEQAPVAERQPVAIEPRTVSPINVPLFTRPAVSGALPHAGASVALPARVPEDFAERDALMKRMIAARPDRANPFTDRGARTRRARLILQSLGRDFGDTEPWINLSQYPNNWPELARKQPAAA